ncbi:MAG: hypothetical protein ABWY58_07695 [Aeromicrobium sp.]
MSFQAYLDAVETRTGRTPRQLVDEARGKGLDDATMAGEKDELWLDGAASKPADWGA